VAPRFVVVLTMVGCAAEGTIAPVEAPRAGVVDVEQPPGDDPAADEPTSPPPAPFVSQVRTLSDLERDVLADALEETGVLDSLGRLGPFAVRELRDVATMQVQSSWPQAVMATGSVWEGGGVQLDVDLANAGPFSPDVEVTALIAWKGLDVANRSVEEAIAILAPSLVDIGSTDLALPNLDPADGSALVYVDSPRGLYAATAGTFDIVDVVLGNATTCAGVLANWITCEVTDGDLEGDFDVDGEDVVTGSTATITGSFDIPAIRLSITDAP